ncbi:hypothetical protein SK128_023408 [Halocaridina rubra]|uniref:Uncharacterized protein n=1 Tax=Halocaridina rubra TaxID=373956 RepID=A0AAN9AD45_HALRR
MTFSKNETVRSSNVIDTCNVSLRQELPRCGETPRNEETQRRTDKDFEDAKFLLRYGRPLASQRHNEGGTPKEQKRACGGGRREGYGNSSRVVIITVPPFKMAAPIVPSRGHCLLKLTRLRPLTVMDLWIPYNGENKDYGLSRRTGQERYTGR